MKSTKFISILAPSYPPSIHTLNQTPHNPRQNPQTHITHDHQTPNRVHQGLQVPPLNPRLTNPNPSLTRMLLPRRNMKIRHVLKVKDRFLAKTMLVLNNYSPEDA